MLIVVLLVLGVGFLQTIMKLLLDVMDSFNKFGYLIILGLSMGDFFLCSCNGQHYVIGGKWPKSQAHLKMVVANRVLEGSIVAMLNIRKTLIRCAWMFGIIHPQYMNNHLIDYLYLSISFWAEGSRFGQLVVHHRL
jgi:hypothetical protein